MRGDAKLKCRRPEKVFQCLINVYLTPCLRCPLRNELRHLKRFSGYDKWNYDGDWSKTRIQLVSYVVLTLPEVVHGNCVGPITVKKRGQCTILLLKIIFFVQVQEHLRLLLEESQWTKKLQVWCNCFALRFLLVAFACIT